MYRPWRADPPIVDKQSDQQVGDADRILIVQDRSRTPSPTITCAGTGTLSRRTIYSVLFQTPTCCSAWGTSMVFATGLPAT
jgi:hypothetical protein